MPHKEQTSSVYFLACDRLIKIGRAVNVTKRISALRVGHPTGEFNLIGTIPGGKDEERAIHHHLAEYRVSGEWFSDCLVVRRSIDVLISSGLTALGITAQPKSNVIYPLEVDAYDALALILKLQVVIGHESIDDLSEALGLSRTKLSGLKYRSRTNGLTMGEVAELLPTALVAVEMAEVALHKLKIEAARLAESLPELAQRAAASNELAYNIDEELKFLRAAATLDGSRSEALSAAPDDGNEQ